MYLSRIMKYVSNRDMSILDALIIFMAVDIGSGVSDNFFISLLVSFVISMPLLVVSSMVSDKYKS